MKKKLKLGMEISLGVMGVIIAVTLGVVLSGNGKHTVPNWLVFLAMGAIGGFLWSAIGYTFYKNDE